jgi:uncharacterized protein with PIN domain
MPATPFRPCPECNHEVRRAHRGPLDRLLSGLVRVLSVGRRTFQRYACTNCYWRGLRLAVR